MSHSRSTRKQYPVNMWIQENNFEDGVCMDILEEISPDEGLEYLEESEKMWIGAFRYLGYDLLNISTGGRLPNGYTHSEEQKALWSKQRKGSISGDKNPNYGKKGSAHHAYGVSISEERKQHLSILRSGEGNPNYGKSPSLETRLKLSVASKGVPKPSSRISAHTRHHTNKGVSKPETCNYCKESDNV